MIDTPNSHSAKPYLPSPPDPLRSPRSPAAIFRSYGIFGLFRLALDWLATRLYLPQARLLRRPFYIRGKRWMEIGRGLTTGPGMRLDASLLSTSAAPTLRIGKDVQINDYVHIAAEQSITIGDRVLIASRVFISDHNHGSYKGDLQDSPLTPPAKRALSVSPVFIEDDVWIGEAVAILPGVHIGRGAIIGAMSVVTRDVPAFCIAVGIPARVTRRFNQDTQRWDPA